MKIRIKESKQKVIKVKEAITLDNVYQPRSHGMIQTSFLAELFRFFHLSSLSLHKRNDTFTFNPRVTKRPYEDDNHFVIEDDFTPRISLATSIEEATEALYTGNEYEPYYVYACDIESRIGDEIPESSLVHLPVQLQRCKQDLSTDGNEYGTNFDMMKYLGAKGIIPKQRKRESNSEWQERTDAIDYSSPSALPSEHKAKFYACVPDADETNEYWSTIDTKMYYLGTHIANSGIVTLSAHGKRLIAQIMKEEGYET